MPDISALTGVSWTTLTNGSTISHTEHNTWRTGVQDRVSDLNTVVADLEDNYASNSAPGDKPEGKLWCDTTNDPAILKYYKDGSNNTETLVGLTLTQTLTNKTLTAPTIGSGFTLTGDITATGGALDIDLVDNNASALSFDATGKAGILEIDTTDSSEQVKMSGDLSMYNANNDGNPEIRLGSADAEELHIQSVFDSAAQTLDYVLFQTDVASATANKGLFRFNVDGTNILDIDDGGIDLDSGMALSIAGTDVLNATTLGSGVTASSLTSVGTLSSLTITGDLTVDTDTLYVDSTNNRVGIGTSSPGSYSTLAYDLVVGTTSGNHGITISGGATGYSSLHFTDNATTTAQGFVQYGHTADDMQFGVGESTRMTIDSSGNVGIGVTPETWQSTLTALQIGGNATIAHETAQGASGVLSIGQNVYRDSGGTLDYISTDESSIYQQYNGLHYFGVAGSGTADTAITYTTGMVIANDGNVGIGTSPSVRFHCTANTAGDVVHLFNNDDATAGVSSSKLRVACSTNEAQVQAFAPTGSYTYPEQDDTALFKGTGSNGINISATHATGTIDFSAGGASSSQVRIDSSGNVGINDASPEISLAVGGAFGVSTEESSGNYRAGDNGTYSYDVDNMSTLALNTGGTVTVERLQNGVSGQVLFIHSTGSSGTHTFKHDSGTGTGQRMYFPGSADFVGTNYFGLMMICYNGAWYAMSNLA